VCIYLTPWLRVKVKFSTKDLIGGTDPEASSIIVSLASGDILATGSLNVVRSTQLAHELEFVNPVSIQEWITLEAAEQV